MHSWSCKVYVGNNSTMYLSAPSHIQLLLPSKKCPSSVNKTFNKLSKFLFTDSCWEVPPAFAKHIMLRDLTCEEGLLIFITKPHRKKQNTLTLSIAWHFQNGPVFKQTYTSHPSLRSQNSSIYLLICVLVNRNGKALYKCLFEYLVVLYRLKWISIKFPNHNRLGISCDQNF
jgi:hypothetical protein